ncbi:unnamed protein product [Lactuca virosa]|uniref:Uncharacterized protein n=1 Tax=Lactuca virosa TaxID=75947 RepID=A0AAU9NL43_9ASTR|nr:unnamed protein product [Lactuca virosa]
MWMDNGELSPSRRMVIRTQVSIRLPPPACHHHQLTPPPPPSVTAAVTITATTPSQHYLINSKKSQELSDLHQGKKCQKYTMVEDLDTCATQIPMAEITDEGEIKQSWPKL